jgi:hypothetical protein
MKEAVKRRVLIILNDPPYGTERVFNGLRLADAVAKREEGAELRIFLMGDAVVAANGPTKPAKRLLPPSTGHGGDGPGRSPDWLLLELHGCTWSHRRNADHGDSSLHHVRACRVDAIGGSGRHVLSSTGLPRR